LDNSCERKHDYDQLASVTRDCVEKRDGKADSDEGDDKGHEDQEDGPKHENYPERKKEVGAPRRIVRNEETAAAIVG
jgi:hypothetical protein